MAIARVAALAFLFSTSTIAAAQLVGDFYLDKSAYTVGEPIILHFKVTNVGRKSVNIVQADPYSFCSGYRISLSNDPATAGSNSSCARGFAGDCLSSDTTLNPAQAKVENILLNFEHDLSNPGDYELEASRTLPWADSGIDFFRASKSNLELETRLYFRVVPGVPSTGMMQTLVNQLQAPDPAQRREAARALASTAPVELEDLLLTFKDKPEFRQFAPLAFHRLNTARSRAALAELLTTTQPGTYENMTSADYLGNSGDMEWFPVLREMARRNAKISNYVADAAELGGGRMIPVLLELMTSPDKQFTRLNAISGLGHTNSREAVPILINLLGQQGADAEYAEGALQTLTHRSVPETSNRYLRWSEWWNREAETAPIYKANECGDVTPLQ